MFTDFKVRERERGRDDRCLLYAPRPVTKPRTQVCALTSDWAHSILVYGMMLQPTKPHSQG